MFSNKIKFFHISLGLKKGYQLGMNLITITQTHGSSKHRAVSANSKWWPRLATTVSLCASGERQHRW